MLRIAVITDAHANLPALRAALEAIRAEGCEAIYHTGDAIAIGPQPGECLDLLLDAGVCCLAGNHESYFVDGLPDPLPACMGEGEAEHQFWTHVRLAPLRPVLARWPYVLIHEFEGVKAAFLHYALAPSGPGFAPTVCNPAAADLDRLFASQEADLIFYGHDHSRSDVQGQARYVNPGSLGCYDRPVARYCVVELERGRYTIQHRAASYDDAGLFGAFEARKVPEREFIYQAFFGGRFQKRRYLLP